MTPPERRWPASHILVVDDIPENRLLLSEQLDQSGYAVTTVSSGAQALAAAASVPPDLILLDIDMPGMDGYQVCARLKADPALREIPVIFLSGLGDTDHKVRGFAAGGIDYLTKPFEALPQPRRQRLRHRQHQHRHQRRGDRRGLRRGEGDRRRTRGGQRFLEGLHAAADQYDQLGPGPASGAGHQVRLSRIRALFSAGPFRR